MAKVKNNVVMHGMSGLLYDMLVFRQLNDQTIAAKRGVRVAAYSDKQKDIWAKFRLAAAYAKGANNDPVLKAIYKALAGKGQSAYNAAFADYFTVPVIADPDTTAYTGAIGGKIKIPATDDYKVVSVEVRLFKADGTPIESGLAIADPDGLHWVYTATQANAAIAGTKVTMIAKDTPANVTVKDIVL